MRLSREAILAEIQNASHQRLQAYAVVDSIMDAEHHPSHRETIDTAFENISRLGKRIAELNAMLQVT